MRLLKYLWHDKMTKIWTIKNTNLFFILWDAPESIPKSPLQNPKVWKTINNILQKLHSFSTKKQQKKYTSAYLVSTSVCNLGNHSEIKVLFTNPPKNCTFCCTLYTHRAHFFTLFTCLNLWADFPQLKAGLRGRSESRLCWSKSTKASSKESPLRQQRRRNKLEQFSHTTRWELTQITDDWKYSIPE